jgi:neutral ceramidase
VKSGLTAGVSLVDISPGPGIELAGYPHHPRNNTGIHDPLHAGCICLDDGATKLALVCMDLAIYPKAEVRAVREEASRLTGIPAGNILISCSHTHSGPWTSGMAFLDVLGMGWRVDEGYVAALRGRLVDLIHRAWKSSFEASIGIGKGFCGREQGVGGNRRDPLGLADPEVWTIGVKDLSGALRACLVKYTLHPTFLHSDNFLVSADYPGYIREHLGTVKPGMTLLFAQGCSGNQSPRYFRSGKTYDEARRVGYAIGAEAARVLDGLDYRRDAHLRCRSDEVQIELRKLPPRRDAEEAVARARSEWERLKATSTVERDVWNAELRFLGTEDILSFVLMQERSPHGRIADTDLPAEVQVLGIGDTRIVGLPGELFVEFGMTIQYCAPFEQCFVIELANGCLPGYACTAQAYVRGGYETGASLLTGHSGEQLVETAVRLLWETSGS